MTIEERLNFCKICSNRSMSAQLGLVCSLTDQKPDFEASCESFSADQEEIARYKQRDEQVEAETAETGMFAMEKKATSKGVIGGIAMMAIAAIWFVLGWIAGYIYFYPPILFLIGAYALIKGLAQGNYSGRTRSS